jgi:hypothetical protein
LILQTTFDNEHALSLLPNNLMNYTFIDNIYAQFKQESHDFCERQSESLLWEWQTYVAITQAIKELQSGGRAAGRVEYTNFNDLLVLSLGTGQQVTGYDAKQIAKWGARDWLINKGDSPLVDMVYYGSADMVDYNLSTIFNLQNCGTNYLRIQV